MTAKSIHIDALRGCAILAVLQFHYGTTFGLYAFLGVPDAVQLLLSGGWAGVDLFFVLSAFLLTRNLLAHRGEPGAAPNFYLRRALRILPLYLFLLALTAALASLLGTARGEPGGWLLGGLAPAWTYGVFAQNFWSGLQPRWTGHMLAPTWSLAVEEHFYLLLPLLILRHAPRQIAGVALGFIVAAPLLRYGLIETVGATAAQTFSFARLDSFGWGVLAALAAHDGAPAQFERVWKNAGVILIVAFAAVALLRASNDAIATLYYSGLALIAARLTLIAALRPVTHAPTAPVRLAAWLGSRCYSLYLLHMPVAGLTAVAFGLATPHALTPLGVGVIAVAAVLTLTLADLSFRHLERPFIAFGERLTRSARAAAPVVVGE